MLAGNWNILKITSRRSTPDARGIDINNAAAKAARMEVPILSFTCRNYQSARVSKSNQSED
jgi:hypothetical protein